MVQRNQINLNKSLPEIFERIAELPTNKEKASSLRMYDGKTIRWFIDAMYNRDWSDMVIPKYTPSKRPPEISHQSIKTAINRIEQAYFYRLTDPKLTEKNLMLVLEEMSAPEAELLCNVFAGRRKIEGISKAVFKEAYPEFFRSVDSFEELQG